MIMGVTKSHANNDFWYDKELLDREFSTLKNEATFELQFSKLAIHSADSSEFTLYDLELEPFCTGFCCGPVGMITYYDSKSSNTIKKSYWLGCATFAATLAAGFVGLVIYDGGFFFF